MHDITTTVKEATSQRSYSRTNARTKVSCDIFSLFHSITHAQYMVLCHSSDAVNILKTKCQKALSRNKAFCQSWEQVANSSAGTASDWKVRSNTDSGSTPRCSKGFLLPSPLWRQTVLRCSYSPRMQSHASTSVCAVTLSLPLWHHNYNVLDDVSAGKTS